MDRVGRTVEKNLATLERWGVSEKDRRDFVAL